MERPTLIEWLEEEGLDPTFHTPKVKILTEVFDLDKLPDMRIQELQAERDTFDDQRVPRHENSFRRDRFERYDELTRQIAELETQPNDPA